MSGRQSGAAAGIVMLAFVLLAVGAFSALSAIFEYPDILRQPTDVVLLRFADGGPALVFVWFLFALSALSFVFVAVLVGRWTRERLGTPAPLATAFGVASAVLQAVGLMRWVFVVPLLAARYGDPSASEAERAAIVTVFGVIHQYGGVAIGESLGQLTLVVWTAGVGIALFRMRGFWRLLSIVPLATVPLWLLAETELLHTAVPSVAVIDTAPVAFMLWEAWLLVFALLLIVARSPNAAATAAAPRPA
jgi:hypothetical protein